MNILTRGSSHRHGRPAEAGEGIFPGRFDRGNQEREANLHASPNSATLPSQHKSHGRIQSCLPDSEVIVYVFFDTLERPGGQSTDAVQGTGHLTRREGLTGICIKDLDFGVR
jgi:hypothetical protein